MKGSRSAGRKSLIESRPNAVDSFLNSTSKDNLARSFPSKPETGIVGRHLACSNDLFKKFLNITSAKSEKTNNSSFNRVDERMSLGEMRHNVSYLEASDIEIKNSTSNNRESNSGLFVSKFAQTKSKPDPRLGKQSKPSWGGSDSDSLGFPLREISHSFNLRESRGKDNGLDPAINANIELSDKKYLEESLSKILSKHNKSDNIDYSITLDPDSDDDDVPDELRSESKRERSPIGFILAPFTECSEVNNKQSNIEPMPSLLDCVSTDSDSSDVCPQRPSFSSIQKFRESLEKVPVPDYESSDSDSIIESSNPTVIEAHSLIGKNESIKNVGGDCFVSDKTSETPFSNSEDDCFITTRNRIPTKFSDKPEENNIFSNYKKSIENRWSTSQAPSLEDEKASFLRARSFLSKFTGKENSVVDSQSVGRRLDSTINLDTNSSKNTNLKGIQSKGSAFKSIDKVSVSEKPYIINKNVDVELASQNLPNGLVVTQGFKSSDNVRNPETVLNVDNPCLTIPRKSSMKSRKSESKLTSFNIPTVEKPTQINKACKKTSIKEQSQRSANLKPNSTENLLKILSDSPAIQEESKVKYFKDSRNKSQTSTSEGMDFQKSANTRVTEKKETKRYRQEFISPTIAVDGSVVGNRNVGHTGVVSFENNKVSTPEGSSNMSVLQKVSLTQGKLPLNKALIKPVAQVNETCDQREMFKSKRSVGDKKSVQLSETMFRPISRSDTPYSHLSALNLSSIRSTDASSKMEMEQIFLQSQRNHKKNTFGHDKASTPWAAKSSETFVETSAKARKTPFVDTHKKLARSVESSITLAENTASSCSLSTPMSNQETVDKTHKISTQNVSRLSSIVLSSSNSDSSFFLSPLGSQKISQTLNFTRLVNTDANNNTLEDKKGLLKGASPAVLDFFKPAKTYTRKAVEKPSHKWFMPTTNNKKKTVSVARPIKKKKLFHLQSNYKESFSSIDSFHKDNKPKSIKILKGEVKKLPVSLFDIEEVDEHSGEEQAAPEKTKRISNLKMNVGVTESFEQKTDNLRRSVRIKHKVNYREMSDTETDKSRISEPGGMKKQLNFRDNEKNRIKTMILKNSENNNCANDPESALSFNKNEIDIKSTKNTIFKKSGYNKRDDLVIPTLSSNKHKSEVNSIKNMILKNSGIRIDNSIPEISASQLNKNKEDTVKSVTNDKETIAKDLLKKNSVNNDIVPKLNFNNPEDTVNQLVIADSKKLTFIPRNECLNENDRLEERDVRYEKIASVKPDGKKKKSNSLTNSESKDVYDFSEKDSETGSKVNSKNNRINKRHSKDCSTKKSSHLSNLLKNKEIILDDKVLNSNEADYMDMDADQNDKSNQSQFLKRPSMYSSKMLEKRIKIPVKESYVDDVLVIGTSSTVEDCGSESPSCSLKMTSIRVDGIVHHPDNYEPQVVSKISAGPEVVNEISAEPQVDSQLSAEAQPIIIDPLEVTSKMQSVDSTTPHLEPPANLESDGAKSLSTCLEITSQPGNDHDTVLKSLLESMIGNSDDILNLGDELVRRMKQNQDMLHTFQTLLQKGRNS